MAIVDKAAASLRVTAASTTWNAPVPAGAAAGDVVEFHFFTNDNHTLTSFPAGTQNAKRLSSFDDNNDGVWDADNDPTARIVLWTVPSTVPSTVAFGFDAAEVGLVLAVLYSGVDTANGSAGFVSKNQGSGDGTTITWPDITSDVDGARISRGALLAGSGVIADPTGTARSVKNVSGESPSAILATFGNKSPAGAVGTVTATYTGSATYGSSYVHLLRPAGGNAPPLVNAGADKADVEPGTPITLVGSVSDSDGTIASSAWSLPTPPEVARNRVYDGSGNLGSTDATSWAAVGNNVSAPQRGTAADDGSRLVAVTKSATSTGLGLSTTAMSGLAAGTRVRIQAEVFVPATGSAVRRIQLDGQDTSGSQAALTGSAQTATVVPGAWATVVRLATVTASRTFNRLRITALNGSNTDAFDSGDSFSVRRVMVTLADDPLSSGSSQFFDGASANASEGTNVFSHGWAGTAYASDAVRRITPALLGTGLTRTFYAPALMSGLTLTYRLTATDNSGATSVDDVNVVVLQGTEFHRVGSAWLAVIPAAPGSQGSGPPEQVTNMAIDPAGATLGTGGAGRFSNDRFTGNSTYAAITNAADGPLRPDGTKQTSYARLTVSSGRATLGWHLADNPAAGTPTQSKLFTVTPGSQYRVTLMVRSSLATRLGLYARGASTSAWVDSAGYEVGTRLVGKGTWTELSYLVTVNAGVTRLALSLIDPDNIATGTVIEATMLMVTAGSSLYTYGDGASAGWLWNGATNGSSSYGPSSVRNAVTPSATPNRPGGYTFLKSLDFSTSDGWSLSDGYVKASATMRASAVSFGQGPQGKSLRLAAGRDAAGNLYSSEVRGPASKHAIPNWVYDVVKVRYPAPVGGIWPAIWLRGFVPSNSEIDIFELFGTIAHGNMHTTPYTLPNGQESPEHRQRPTDNYPGAGAASAADVTHTLERLSTPAGYSYWWDGVFIGTITPNDFDANATPTTANGGTGTYTDDFDNPSKTWQPICSNQINTPAYGTAPSGEYVWPFFVDSWDVYVPAA